MQDIISRVLRIEDGQAQIRWEIVLKFPCDASPKTKEFPEFLQNSARNFRKVKEYRNTVKKKQEFPICVSSLSFILFPKDPHDVNLVFF